MKSCNITAAWLLSAQGPTGHVNLPGLPHELAHQWWALPGQCSGKVIQSSSESKLRGEPWRGLWPCWD